MDLAQSCCTCALKTNRTNTSLCTDGVSSGCAVDTGRPNIASGLVTSPARVWRSDDWAPLSRMAQLGLRHQPLLTCQRLDCENVHVHCLVMSGSAIGRCDALLCRPTQHFLLGPMAVTSQTYYGEGFSRATQDRLISNEQPSERRRSALRRRYRMSCEAFSWRSLVEAEGRGWDRG